MKNFVFGILFSLYFQPLHAVPVQGSHILISAHCPYATSAAIKVAESGGNPVDVALTAMLVMSVTNPSFGTLGGGGFALVKIKDQVEALDFRETAPKAMNPDYYKDKGSDASILGGTAVGVPGTPAGIFELHQRYGKIHWSRLFDDAIHYAEKGFRVTGEWADDTINATKDFNGAGKKFFLKNSNKSYRPGDLFRQPQLAKVLKEMRNRKVVDFYRGKVARDIVNSIRKEGGHMSLEDLRDYKVKWRNPLVEKFRGHNIYLMPPPSSGGLVIQTALRLIEPMKLESTKPRSVDEYHGLIEIFRRAYRGRALLGDPDYHENPIATLLSPKYLQKLARSYNPQKAHQLKPLDSIKALQKESTETSHISVLNSQGQGIAITLTANGNYGSKVASHRFGIILNNEMDDFTSRPGEPNMFGLIQGHSNRVQPGKRPLSSMSPTLVEKNGEIVMAIGAPGGPRIISSVFQSLYRIIVRGDSIDQAIQAARVHHQFLPNKVFLDADRLSPETLEQLKKRGHVTEAGWQGRVYGVMKRGDRLEGAFDSRGEGSVAGY